MKSIFYGENFLILQLHVVALPCQKDCQEDTVLYMSDYLQKASRSTHVLISEVTEIARRADDGELLEGRTEKQEICRRWNNE